MELWARKAMVCLKSGKWFCGSLKDKKVEGKADDKGLACKSSRRKMKDSIRVICYFKLRFCGS